MTNESAKKFLKVYDDVLQCKRLAIWDRLTISLAISYGENGCALFASQQTIADRLGTSRDTVKRSVANLKKLPFVNVECRGLKKSLVITVNLPLLEKWLVDMVQDAPSDMVQDAPSMVQDAPLLDNSLDHSSLKDQFELHGNFAGKIALVSTTELIDDDSSKSEGHESKEGLPLVDELGNGFQRCRQMVELMTKLRNKGLDQLIIGRMPIEQWERCENSLDAIFSERASDTHLEQHIFDMLDGPLAKAKKVNLHKLACTHALDSDFDHEHLILNCYGFDNAGYAC
ncbi:MULTISPECIES: helix-turn-helix domain-containing protein [Aeromonas]|uniref:helix-turn-helix domain-containing protein n=1 Tax=Aeromonas TaxID=642 RepID=UPI001115BBD1|nr:MULTISPECIES: helix-turn-helix domain-containing protein [Aeromonas]MBE8734507.1 hypothetical protein [Aeromonas veronii]MBE8737942.1 hypothetical protein [Aeromonas veronii]MBE8743107.1 hypothetical protein [Aeromonas veronii]MBE8762411.1 hypothetical protein [Aeromonas veronii]MBE8838653.1 hypothetical protein [Aeromonas veronii]